MSFGRCQFWDSYFCTAILGFAARRLINPSRWNGQPASIQCFTRHLLCNALLLHSQSLHVDHDSLLLDRRLAHDLSVSHDFVKRIVSAHLLVF